MVIQILKQISFKSTPKKQSWNMEIDIKKFQFGKENVYGEMRI